MFVNRPWASSPEIPNRSPMLGTVDDGEVDRQIAEQRADLVDFIVTTRGTMSLVQEVLDGHPPSPGVRSELQELLDRGQERIDNANARIDELNETPAN